jgi:hypothetical protein
VRAIGVEHFADGQESDFALLLRKPNHGNDFGDSVVDVIGCQPNTARAEF